MKVIIHCQKNSSETSEQIVRKTFASISDKISIESIEERMGRPLIDSIHDANSHNNQFNQTTMLHVTFRIQESISDLGTTHDVLKDVKKMIKKAIALKNYLEFVRFEDMPKINEFGMFKGYSATFYHATQSLDPVIKQSSRDLQNTNIQLNSRFQSLDLLCYLKLISLGKAADLTKSFFESVVNENYSQAVRRAATVTDPIGFELIKALYEYPNLKIDLNERAGINKRNALHHAAFHGNTELYEYLVQKSADMHLPDADNKTPQDYLNTYNYVKN